MTHLGVQLAAIRSSLDTARGALSEAKRLVGELPSVRVDGVPFGEARQALDDEIARVDIALGKLIADIDSLQARATDG